MVFKLKKIFLFTLVFFSIFFLKEIQAYEMEVYLDPDSGGITGAGTKIDIMVDPKNEEFIGMYIYLEYTGPIEFVDFETGNIPGCEVDEEMMTSDSMFLSCLMFNDGYTGNVGKFATLNFKATGSGNASVMIEEADTGFDTEVSDGSYQADPTGSSTQDGWDDEEDWYWDDEEEEEDYEEEEEEDEEEEEEEEELPDTSIFSFVTITFGITLIFVSIFLLTSEKRTTLVEKKSKVEMRYKISD